MEKTAVQIIPTVMTALKAQPTKAEPVTIEELEKSLSWDFRFKTFEDPKLEAMLLAAHRFCWQMLTDQKPHWLALLGTCGAGKTHLARWIGNFARCRWARYPTWHKETGWILAERCVAFYDWRKRVDKMRSGEYDVIDGMAEDEFCVVDDIGAEDATGFSKSKLDDLCNRRLGKWTVFTANLSLDQIHERIDARVASRMIRDGNIVVDVETADYAMR